jgi:hypothetical protein
MWSLDGRLATTAPTCANALIVCRELVTKHFRGLVLMLCCGYLALQVRYVWGLPLVMDEFANAGHIIRVTQGVPYRDYIPYKTIVGYYILLPALLASDSSWTAMLVAKLEVACLTTVVVGVVALGLRRHFSAVAIVGSLSMLVTQSTFLERASELRVDMLSALFGLVSLLAHLERRDWTAGVAAAGAVLMTQKGAYFVLSLGGSLLFQAALFRTRLHLRQVVVAGLSVALVIGAYVGIWSWIASPERVWQSMFEGPQRIAFVPMYSLNVFWAQTLDRNPIFYALGIAGWALLLPSVRGRVDDVGVRLWAYSSILAVLCIWHKQPWPYFFVMLIPTVWVVGIAALERSAWQPRWSLVVGGLVAFASLASLVGRLPTVLGRSSTSQRLVVEAAEAFLGPQDEYLAGTELVWQRRHMPQLSWLDAPRLQALHADPAEALQELRGTPPRLVVENYRIANLPPALLQEVNDSFVWVGGNLGTYAPTLPDGNHDVRFAHGGLYRVTGSREAVVSVDGGAWLRPDASLLLTSGFHRVHALGGVRLVSWSDDSRFVTQVARPSIALFDSVYAY